MDVERLREALDYNGAHWDLEDEREIAIFEAAQAHLACGTVTDEMVEACEKCGNTDIYTRYDKDGHACLYDQRGEADTFDDMSREGSTCCRITEHLHRSCRNCSFSWADPVAAFRVETGE